MSDRALLWSLCRPRLARLLRLMGWAAVLAAATAAYGALIGPVLRALFGGDGLTWPGWAAAYLPPPPSVEALRQGLPFVVVAVALVKGWAFHRHTVGTTALGQAVVLDLRRRVHQRVMALPPDAAAMLGTGDLQSRATHDADAAERLVTGGLAAVLRDGLQVAALLSLCVAIDWRLAVLAFGVYPLVFWPIARLARRLRRAAGRAHEARSALSTVLHDHLVRLPLVQQSGAEAAADARFDQAARGAAAAVVGTARVRALATPLTEVIGAVALAGTLWYATRRIEAGALAPEHVLSFFVALLMLYQPVKGLVRAQEVIQPGRAALARVATLLAMPERLPAGGRGLPPPARAPRVELRDVVVERGGRRALDSVSASFEPGRVTALVGPNGAGKTTVAWLVARLLDPVAGEVRLDGRPLVDLDVTAWRRRVGWVTQAPALGRGTLRENVLFGLAQPPEEAALAEAVQVAGLEPLVARVGWDRPLGDDGAGLSGGERRRVAIARALVRDPLLVVLDEPEAHLDAEGAAGLRALLPSLARGRTVLLITHDERTAALADAVVALDAGRVVARPVAA